MLRRLMSRLNSLEGSLLRYALSATLLLALPSCLISALVVFAQDETVLIEMIQILKRFLPEELIFQAVEYFLKEDAIHRPFLVSVGISVWLVSKSLMHFMQLNKKEHQSQIPAWMLRILSVILAIQIGCCLIVPLILIRVFHLNVMISIEAAICVSLLLLYRGVSLQRAVWYDEVIGVLCAWIGLHGIGLFFFFYIRTIASYDVMYGPLSTIIIVLLSCFAVSNVLYIGYSSIELFREHHCCRPHYPKIEKLGERIWKFW